MRARWLIVPLAAAACDLSETTVPVGESVIVVHAVMRPDLPPSHAGRQFIVVEETFAGEVGPQVDPLTGDTVFQRGQDATIPFGGVPALPVRDAVVEIENLTVLNDPCGAAVGFFHDDTRPGIYWSPQGCPTMRPGDRLALRVARPSGQIVTGETTVPGLDSVGYDALAGSGTFETTQQLVFNRDQDTLRLRAYGEAGRLLQFEVRRDGDLADFGTKILADSTRVAVPGDLINTFVLGDEDDVFRAGRNYRVTVAITDTNYFDFVRSNNNEFTGRGFINRLTGGIGVFGSLTASSTSLKAVGDQDDPREGRYRMQGTVLDSVDIDVTMDIYLAREESLSDHSTFVEGQWLYGSVETSSDGFFNENRFQAVIIDTLGFVRSDSVRGNWVEGQPWDVSVFVACADPNSNEHRPPGTVDPCAATTRRIGVLTMTKVGS